MRAWIILTLWLSAAVPCTAAEFDPFEGSRPIAVYIQTNPWGQVKGADNPRVAVYENGEVIFTRKVDGRRLYQRAQLDAAQLAEVHERLGPVLALGDLKRSYDAVEGIEDLTEARFYLRDGEREVVSSVYGLLPPQDAQAPWARKLAQSNEAQRRAVPAQLIALHEWLCALDYPDARDWDPKYVEVMFQDYPNATEASIQWPKEWPALDSDRAVVRRADAHSIFLDGALLPEVTRLLATRKKKGAIEVSGKKLLAAYRPTFPSEPVWRRAFHGEAP